MNEKQNIKTVKPRGEKIVIFIVGAFVLAAVILIAFLYKIYLVPENQISEKKIDSTQQEQVPVQQQKQPVIEDNKENIGQTTDEKPNNEQPVFNNIKSNPEFEAKNNIEENNNEESEPDINPLATIIDSASVRELNSLNNQEAFEQDEDLENAIDKLNNSDKDMLLEELSKTDI